MTNVYKVQLFRWDLSNRDDYRKYAIEENIVAFGWPAKETVSSVEEYCDIGEKWFSKERKDRYTNLTSWRHVLKCLRQPNENETFLWTQDDKSRFYLGKLKGTLELPSEQNWKLNNSQVERGKVGIVRCCEWHQIPSIFVPGDIATYARNDGTIRLIATNNDEKYNPDYIHYCQFLYKNYDKLNEESGWEKIKGINFYQLLHTDDLEDLVGIFLQKELNYLVFPSTNKQGTKDYEYRLICKEKDNETQKHHEAIIQCKNNANIPWDTLKKYTEENIYVLSVKETKNKEDSRTLDSKNMCSEDWDMGWQSKDGRIKMFDAKKLEAWARNNQDILPKRIQNFLNFSKKTN